MINNFININKANYHFFPQIIEHKKRSWHKDGVGIPGHGLGQAQHFGRVKPVIMIPTPNK